MDLFEAITARRSIGRLSEPAPDPEQLATILAAAVRAPDHGELRPWRFVVLEGESLDAFGLVLADAYRARCERAGETPDPAKLDKERTKLRRAPMVIAVGCHPTPGRIPADEQVAAVASATQNLLLAATALGFGTMWRTGEPAHDPTVAAALGFAAEDTVMGFVYVGSIADEARKPPRLLDAAALDSVVHRWQAAEQAG